MREEVKVIAEVLDKQFRSHVSVLNGYIQLVEDEDVRQKLQKETKEIEKHIDSLGLAYSGSMKVDKVIESIGAECTVKENWTCDYPILMKLQLEEIIDQVENPHVYVDQPIEITADDLGIIEEVVNNPTEKFEKIQAVTGAEIEVKDGRICIHGFEDW